MEYPDNIFLIYPQKCMLWYSLEVPWWSTLMSNHNICFWGEIKINYLYFLAKTKVPHLALCYCCMKTQKIPLITKTSLFKYMYIENFTSRTENFQIKNFDIFHISAQNIDCGHSLDLSHWGSSNKYPQSMFLSKNKNNNVYPCKPQFYYIKVGFKEVKII